MAFGVDQQWMIWSTGSDTNAGGFNPGNANFSTDLTATSGTGNSPVVSSASYNFVAGDVGYHVFIKSGTNWTPGWYEIASVAANAATLKAAVGEANLYATTPSGQTGPAGANTVAGCATTASPTGGTWGMDYSRHATQKIAFTDLVIDGTTNTDFTSAANPIAVNHIGNIINVTSGTGFTVQRVEVVSIPSGVIGRADKSMGTLSSTGGNGRLGGACATLPTPQTVSVAGNKLWIKATATYTLGTTWTLATSVKGDVTNGLIWIEGYTTQPGARDGRPVIDSTTNGVVKITMNDNDFTRFVHLKFTHSSGTKAAAFTPTGTGSSPVFFEDLVVDGCSAFFSSVAAILVPQFIYCEILNTTATSAVLVPGGSEFYGCDIHDNTGDGIRGVAGTTGTIRVDSCIFDTNGGKGIDPITTNANMTYDVRNCIFVDNTSDGFLMNNTSGSTTLTLFNNIFWNNSGYGVNNADALNEVVGRMGINRNNAYGNNVLGPRLNVPVGVGDVTLTADPFTSKAGRDFSLNNDAGGGALLRAAGFPTGMPNSTVTTTTYRNIGIAQQATGPNPPTIPLLKFLRAL